MVSVPTLGIDIHHIALLVKLLHSSSHYLDNSLELAGDYLRIYSDSCVSTSMRHYEVSVLKACKVCPAFQTLTDRAIAVEFVVELNLSSLVFSPAVLREPYPKSVELSRACAGGSYTIFPRKLR